MTLNNIKKVNKVSITNQVVEVLRNSIVNGDLQPGTHLREVDLAERIEVSRGSVREALIRLEAEGLVQSHVGRGSFVAELSDQDVVEIYDLRLLLEKEAVRLVTLSASEAQLQTLLDLSEQTIKASRANDIPTLLEINIEFHRLIWQWAENSRLCQLLETYYRQIQLYLASTTYRMPYERRLRAIEDHKNMVLAMMERDPEAAAQMMQTHLSVAEQEMRDFIANKLAQPE